MALVAAGTTQEAEPQPMTLILRPMNRHATTHGLVNRLAAGRYIVLNDENIGDAKTNPAPRHRRIAISLLAGTLNYAAPFFIAVASSGASMTPRKTALAAILKTFQMIGFGSSGFLTIPAVSAAR